METVVQERFEAPKSVPPPEREGLVVHRRGATGSPAGIVLFVHGWQGSRYGTWENFPRFIYEDLPQLDVGMYAYVNGLRRIWTWPSARFEVQVETLADALRDELAGYERIFLVGHSQGGLLCKAALCTLIQRADRATLQRIAGLFLMAAAQAGTNRLVFTPEFLTRDTQVLKPDSPIAQSTQRCFADRVALEPDDIDDRHFLIPTWAVLPDRDAVVDRTSASLGLPSARITNAPGTHTSIVKPEHKGDTAYAAVRKRIAALLAGQDTNRLDAAVDESSPPQQTAAPPPHGQEPVMDDLTPFWGRHGAGELHAALVAAYETASRDRVRIMAVQSGIDSRLINWDRAMSDLWVTILEQANAAGCLAALRDRVLSDRSVRGHHERLRRCFDTLLGGGEPTLDEPQRGGQPPALTSDALADIVGLLIPQVRESSGRRALLTGALFGSPVLDTIDYSGNPQTFATQVVEQLWAFDDGHGRDPALRLLLDYLKGRYGVDKQTAIDQLIRRIWTDG